jgi:transcriptional regulator with GAF, ATPase, and Fis domain
VGELPLALQAKLLRVLQEREFERVGGSETVRVDVRVLAATNRDLRDMVGRGKFREDLYYRLNVFPIEVPPLRERRRDIAILVHAFLRRFGRQSGKRIDGVAPEAMRRLESYRWPGNVRELQNVIERAVILATGGRIELDDQLAAPVVGPRATAAETLEEIERDHIVSVLERVGWRVSGERGAARILGLKRTTLEARMSKLRISRPA